MSKLNHHAYIFACMLVFAVSYGQSAFAQDYIFEITLDQPDAIVQHITCPQAQKSCFGVFNVPVEGEKEYLIDVEARFSGSGSVTLFFMAERQYFDVSSSGARSLILKLDQEGKAHETVMLYRPNPLSHNDTDESGLSSLAIRYSHDVLLRFGLMIKQE